MTTAVNFSWLISDFIILNITVAVVIIVIIYMINFLCTEKKVPIIQSPPFISFCVL